MGNGTFNLTRFFAEMGIKNPSPDMREIVQPVVLVGDFSLLTPQHRPPMQAFGGDVVGVVGEFSIVQVISRAPGGCILAIIQTGTGSRPFQTRDVPITGLTNVVPTARFSNDPVVSVVEAGTDPVEPGNAAISPFTIPSTFATFPGYPIPFWLPQGTAFIFWAQASGVGIIDWTLVLQDILASEIRDQ